MHTGMSAWLRFCWHAVVGSVVSVCHAEQSVTAMVTGVSVTSRVEVSTSVLCQTREFAPVGLWGCADSGERSTVYSVCKHSILW